MKIEEILKNAGIEDAEAIAKIKEAMPKAFMPLADFNSRIAAAKKEAADVQAAFDAFKAEADAASAANAVKEDEAAKKFEALQAQFDKLQGDYTAAQDAAKQRDAKDAITKALKDAGANPAAIALLADAALGRIEYGEDGKPSNVSDVAEAVKGENAGLFGVDVDTGKQSGKSDGDNLGADAFLEGFGDTK